MSADAFTQAVLAVRPTGALFVQAALTAPWSYRSPRAAALAPILEPSAECLVIFHLVTEGECFVEAEGRAPVHLRAGDAVLFPHADGHVLSSQTGVMAPGEAELVRILRGRPCCIEFGGGGAKTQLSCGYVAFDARLSSLLLGGLPPIMHVNVRGSEVGSWLEAAVRYAALEAHSSRPGAKGVLSKLADLLFIEILRLYVNSRESATQGWLAGVSDRIVGGTLNAIHSDPARDWTLASLAKHVGTSRSVLAARFQRLMGTGAMQYLMQWRMLLAADLLSRSKSTLVQIAGQVGYETDTAFNRAFRREYGLPPATWRRLQSAAQAAEPRVEAVT